MKLLHIDSSITGANSISRQVTAEVVRAWREATPGLEVAYRDLERAPLAHLDSRLLGARSQDGSATIRPSPRRSGPAPPCCRSSSTPTSS